MALLTYDWHPPDNSWITQDVIAAARIRQEQDQQRQQMALQLASLNQSGSNAAAERLLRAQELNQIMTHFEMEDARAGERNAMEQQKTDYESGGGASPSIPPTVIPNTGDPTAPTPPEPGMDTTAPLPAPGAAASGTFDPTAVPHSIASQLVSAGGNGFVLPGVDTSEPMPPPPAVPMAQALTSPSMPIASVASAPALPVSSSAPVVQSNGNLPLFPPDEPMASALTKSDDRPMAQRMAELTASGFSRKDAAQYIERTDTSRASVLANAKMTAAQTAANAKLSIAAMHDKNAVNWDNGFPMLNGVPQKYDGEGNLIPAVSKGVKSLGSFQDKDSGVTYTPLSDGSYLGDVAPPPGANLTPIGRPTAASDPANQASALLKRADEMENSATTLEKSQKDKSAPQWPWVGDGTNGKAAGQPYGLDDFGKPKQLTQDQYKQAMADAQAKADALARPAMLRQQASAQRDMANKLLQKGSAPAVVAAPAAPVATPAAPVADGSPVELTPDQIKALPKGKPFTWKGKAYIR